MVERSSLPADSDGVPLSSAADSPPPAFLDQLKDTLENLHDSVYLRKSPVMSLLVPAGLAHSIRGAAVLRRQILEAIEQLRMDESDMGKGVEQQRRIYQVLRLRYVAARPFRTVMADLGLSQAQYHREQRRAIAALATLLWERRAPNEQVASSDGLSVFTRTMIGAFPMGTPSAGPPKLPKEEQEYSWVAGLLADRFYEEGKQGWAAAGRALGIKASLLGSEGGAVDEQVAILEQVIAQPTTAGILLYALDHEAAAPALRQARQRGIAVVIGNEDVPDPTLRDAFVGPRNSDIGTAAADLTAQILNGAGKVGGVGCLTGISGRARLKAFEQRLARNYPRIRLVGVAIGDDTIADTARAAISFLLRYPDVCLLYVSDGSAGRVATALRERGFAGRVRVVGTDRTPELLSGLADGIVAATVVQDTYTEEFVALHYLYWRYNGLTLLPDTTFVQTGNLCGFA